MCSDAGVVLERFNGGDNHVHLLVNFPPDVLLSRLVNSLKGVGSRQLRAEFSELKIHSHLERWDILDRIR